MAFTDTVHATIRDARWILAIALVVPLEVGPPRRVDTRRVIGGERPGAAPATGAEPADRAYRAVR